MRRRRNGWIIVGEGGGDGTGEIDLAGQSRIELGEYRVERFVGFRGGIFLGQDHKGTRFVVSASEIEPTCQLVGITGEFKIVRVGGGVAERVSDPYTVFDRAMESHIETCTGSFLNRGRGIDRKVSGIAVGGDIDSELACWDQCRHRRHDAENIFF